MTQGVGGSTAGAQLVQLAPWARPAPPITAFEREQRIERARALMAAQGVQGLLIGAGASLNYFAGIPWTASERLVVMLLTAEGSAIVVCPAFELGTLQADLAVEAEIRVWEEDENPFALVASALLERRATSLAIDPNMSFVMVQRLRRAVGPIVVEEGSRIIDGCRSVKSAAELALLQQAKDMTLEVQRRTALILEPGMRASIVRRFIHEAHLALGAGGSSFCIVLFGRSTAFPHGLPGDPALEDGDMVLVDTGCTVDGYQSDITRTFVFGRPDDEQRRVWQAERDAQQAAFNAVRPGATCESIDRAARASLEKAGFGPGYSLPGLPHRTGHGVGLSIHEAPYLVRGDRTELRPGMCFSNEPMIVVPGRFGVRLEDHFHVTTEGAAWFTEPSPSIDEPFG